MARSKKPAAPAASAETPAPADHNLVGGLTEEEASALTTYHALNILRDEKAAALKKVEYDAARAVVNGHFKMVSKDLSFTRKEFEAEVIEKLGMTSAEYDHSEAKRARLHRLAGLKQGEQIDLITHVLADTADEAAAAELDGYRAGRRADDPIPPHEVSPILHPDWMRGYHAGQEYNGAQLIKAHEVMSRPKPGTLAAGADPDEPEDEFDPDQGARELKASGWTEPTADEQQFEESAAA